MSLNKGAQLIKHFTLEQIIPLLSKHKESFTINDKEYVVYLGKSTQKLFAGSQVCVNCGRTGTHFRLYHDPKQSIPKFINSMCLFSDDNMLMTADHIVPRSAGGLTHSINLQVMCLKCNQKKADKLPSPEIVDRITEHMNRIKEQWNIKWPQPLPIESTNTV